MYYIYLKQVEKGLKFKMIVLNRKRLTIMLSFVMVALFAFSFKIADKSKTVETVTLPVSNKVIVLDARTSENQMRVRSYCTKKISN